MFRILFPHLFRLDIGFWRKAAWSCALLAWPLGGPAVYYMVVFRSSDHGELFSPEAAESRRQGAILFGKYLAIAFLLLMGSGLAEFIRTRDRMPISAVALLFVIQLLLAAFAVGLVLWGSYARFRNSVKSMGSISKQ